ncbi:MAG TPA: helix-turn-helix domain-containing protein [Acidimicrobiales bacterium]|nr:helix-turn-helix domain-containing protein [Acidimicrobiales bacterium]
MPLLFRNIEATPDDPVSEWHLEGIQAALERGDLSHWRRLAAEVRRHPWGEVSQELAEVLTFSRSYGSASVMDAVVLSSRDEAVRREREVVAAEVRSLREASGLSGREFAARIGTSPSRLSTYASGKVVPSAALMVRMRQVPLEGNCLDRHGA